MSSVDFVVNAKVSPILWATVPTDSSAVVSTVWTPSLIVSVVSNVFFYIISVASKLCIQTYFEQLFHFLSQCH